MPVATPAVESGPAPTAVPSPGPEPAEASPALVNPAPPPAPPKSFTALLVLREGSINGVYFQKGGLSQYGAKLEDFDFLPRSLAKLFPPEFTVIYNIGSLGPGQDRTLNGNLVTSYHPDTLVVLTLQLRTKSQQSYLLLSKTQIQAELHVDFLAPDTLAVIAARTVITDFAELKGLSKKFPPELKDQLARKMAEAIPALPY